MDGGGHQRVIPYPLIDVKATGENILRRRLERGLHGAAPSILLGTTVNDLAAERESR